MGNAEYHKEGCITKPLCHSPLLKRIGKGGFLWHAFSDVSLNKAFAYVSLHFQLFCISEGCQFGPCSGMFALNCSVDFGGVFGNTKPIYFHTDYFCSPCPNKPYFNLVVF